jgi:hypothetical protein
MRIIPHVSKPHSGPSCTPGKHIPYFLSGTRSVKYGAIPINRVHLCGWMFAVLIYRIKTSAFVTYMKGNGYFDVLDVCGHILLK